MLRVVGILLLALGLVALQIIRYKIETLYISLTAIRVMILAGLLWLYALSADPMFLVLSFLVGIGVIITSGTYYLSRHKNQ